MHTARVMVISTSRDGTSFKANLPGKGEQWLKLPSNMKGKAEWKNTYDIGWTETPGERGTFYNVKQLNDAIDNHPVAKAGNGNGEIDIRSIFGLMHSYNGKLPPIPQMVEDLRNARQALELYESGDASDLGDSF